jgi:diadenosine tetraphosphate (Ap4A) HIT family hydrolase
LTCPFCNPTTAEIVLSNDLAFARFDEFPVNPGHILIIPKRHVSSYFDTTQEEQQSMNELLLACKHLLDTKYEPDGYNVGINIGEAAGQSVFHVHMHLIPRYVGDIDNPRGGIRKVITGRRLGS